MTERHAAILDYDVSDIDVPEDFKVLRFFSKYLGHVGPFMEGERNGKSVLAMRMLPKHMNMRDIAHGGILSTLADAGMSFALVRSEPEGTGVSTISLTVNFEKPAKLNDWLEAEVTIDRKGRSVSFTHGVITANGEPILHMSGVFKLIPPAPKD